MTRTVEHQGNQVVRAYLVVTLHRFAVHVDKSGIGSLLISAVHAGDYSLVLGLASLSIVGVAIAVFLIDILSPLLDPRMKAE